MLGTLASQQLFASANSIAAIPQVWAEWNYNSFYKPYVTTSTASSQFLPDSFSTKANWNADSTSRVADSASGYGITSVVDSTSTALLLTVVNVTPSTTVAGSPYSNAFSLPDSKGFYKLVFYVKSLNTYTDIFPSYVKPSDIKVTTKPSDTSKIYYRVIGVGADGQTIGPDLKNNKDLLTVTTASYKPQTNQYSLLNQSGSVTLKFNAISKAMAYNIYRSTTSSNSTEFINSIAAPIGSDSVTYVDDLNNISMPSSPDTVPLKVTLNPQLEIDGSVNNINVVQYIMATDSSGSKLSRNISSIDVVPDYWKKVEMWFGTPSDATINTMSTIKLIANITAEVDNTTIMIDNIQLYKVTEHDFYLNDMYPTESVFSGFRPGEMLLNPLLPSSDKTIKNFTPNPIPRPVSLGIKTPQIYFSKQFIDPYIQIMPSTYDKFKYYVSDRYERSVQAQYDKYLTINKIVLKYSNAFTKISNGTVTLYTGANSTKTNIKLYSSDFNDNGVTILYYDGSNWSTSSWTSPPTLSDSGAFQNVVSNVRGISFTAALPTKSSLVGNHDSTDFYKVHIIELSPRLEIDLSPLLISYDISKELTSQDNILFPLSYINANSGNLVFSNIPIYQSTSPTDHVGYSIFENDSKNTTFYGLLRHGVKFNCFLQSPSFQPDLTENIPQFVMYSEQWDIDDISQAKVGVFDFTKLLSQSQQAPQYYAYNSNLFSIVTDMFAIAGISDYDYDSLKNVCAATVNTTAFWYDESKTVFQNLQDLFILHQIGAYTDEYGVLRFNSLSKIFKQYNANTFTGDFAITDFAATSKFTGGNINYIANIMPDTWTQSINEKIGTLSFVYSYPMVYNSVEQNIKDSGAGAIYDKHTDAGQQVWQEEAHTGLPYFYLDGDLSISSDYIKIQAGHLMNNPRNSIANYEGDLFIGQEIIGYSGLEYIFYPQDQPNIIINKIVNSQNDINDGYSQIKALSPNSTTFESKPTGKILNLQRGKYGTSPQTHKMYKNDKVIKYIFNSFKWDKSLTSISKTNTVKNTTKGIQLNSTKKEEYNAIAPIQGTKNAYNTFSVDFSVSVSSKANHSGIHVVPATYKKDSHGNYLYLMDNKGVKHKIIKTKRSKWTDVHNLALGLFFNADSTSFVNSTDPTFFVEISSSQDSKHKVHYHLEVYYKKKVNNKISRVRLYKGSLKNTFDGIEHTLSVYFSGKNIGVSLNGERVAYVSTYVTFANKSDKLYGAYTKQLEANQATTAFISEVYADKVNQINNHSVKVLDYDFESKYYYSSKYQLTNIINHTPPDTSCFYWRNVPDARGFKLYDVKTTTSPIFADTVSIVQHQYGSQKSLNKAGDKSQTLGPVFVGDLTYSTVLATPFNLKFAICNNTKETVLLNSQSNSTVVPLHANAKHLALSTEQRIDRVIDVNSQNNIEVKSQWLSGKKDVNNMITLMAKSLNNFFTEINVTLFGNPLIQVGDFARLTYSFKKYGYDPNDSSVIPIYALVTKVGQSYDAGVGETKLTLRPILDL